MKERPIFVLGNRRSGTTMLRLMLAAHPRIGIPPEGGFVVSLGWIYGWRRLRDADYPSFVTDFFLQETSQDWGLDRDQLLARIKARRPTTYGEMVDTVYQLYLAEKFPGKPRWGDKTVWYLGFVPTLERYFPEAQIVHLYRDGRDVACSYKKMRNMPHSVARLALEWQTCVGTIRRNATRLGPSRYHEVCYEDLVADPKLALRNLCRFLGEDYAEGMLQFWSKNKRERLEPARHMAWKQLTEHPVTSASCGRWKSELSESEVRTFEAIAGETLRRLGYPTASATSRRRILDAGGALAGAAYSRAWHTRQGLRPYKNLAKHAIRHNARRVVVGKGGKEHSR